MSGGQFNAAAVELFGVDDAARLAQAIALRIAVFVDEQQVPIEEEVDEHDRSDAQAVHAILRGASGEAVATGRFYRRDAKTAQIGRMAVRADSRGSGAGRAVLLALMQEANRRGYERVSLSAQVNACDFYGKAGFRAYGLRFFDAGIEHQEMDRAL